jgi:ubiquitin-like modifier-activating enzyme ATG7
VALCVVIRNAVFLQDVELLSSLMASHDVTFLLTDTRESRWLPTLIAAANDTLLINSALGMDTYLIQRHGGAPLQTDTTTTTAVTAAATNVAAVNKAAGDTTASDSSDSGDAVQHSTAAGADVSEHLQTTADSTTTTTTTATAGTGTAAAVSKTDNSTDSNSNNNSNSCRLGCYFCSDVVAPENSQLNRTLDQQCTVTRPGLAPIAAALAVELMVAVLHHPLQHHAPADSNLTGSEAVGGDSSSSKPLGLLPHQVRATTRTVCTHTSAHVLLKIV